MIVSDHDVIKNSRELSMASQFKAKNFEEARSVYEYMSTSEGFFALNWPQAAIISTREQLQMSYTKTRRITLDGNRDTCNEYR